MDREALKEKYAQEREKRLRADGNDQYIRLEDNFAHYLDDPYVKVQPRDVVTDHVTVAFVGGGYAGLVTGARLAELGVKDYRVIEKGGDFGGTWYWNRYPGARCDTASMIYMPLLEETGHMPQEKYARAPEILEHCKRIGKQYNLYDKALFHTRVTQLTWDQDAGVWQVSTDRGDNFTAQFVIMGTGPLHVPKLPGLPGIENFKGHSFHTSRWDYEYTGGDPNGALDKLGDKKVALIGTGATSVQCVPHLSASCGTFYVCQRTPSSVDVRSNAEMDPAWYTEATRTSGWQQRWMENFTNNMTPFGNVTEDLVNDGWTDLARRFRGRLKDLPEEQRGDVMMMLQAYEETDYEKMDAIRARVDEEVSDPETAANLKGWYRQLCKRPCFHDGYLSAFNNPSTKLLDTDGEGVERITENGVVVGGVEYPVDCIIYATGFLIGTELSDRSGFEVVGRDGVALSDYWEKGMRTLHGMSSHNFPNAFRVQPTQGGNFIANVPHNIVESGKTIAMMIKHTLDSGHQVIETTQAAEEAWLQLLSTSAQMLADPTCTPGYYNNEGQPMPDEVKSYVGHPGGAMAFFQYIDEWRESGKFEGMEFR
ncbi:MAG: cation diffusion facilitator CzcD-associated flavoprotein CzcO [Bacteroidia bacterium]|jgi:cation diffusion facilitator CzcD-associated flavoprotein CzcO